MLGREALVVLANLSELVASKMDKPIAHMWGWVNGRIAIMEFSNRVPLRLKLVDNK